jgi:hypothetical protein
MRCGNEWESRIEGRPKNCPSCKSPRWFSSKASVGEAGRASALVGKAIRNGQLVKGPCSVCGATERVEGHHEDYSKPLEVVWLCKLHHRRRHAEIGEPLMDGNAPGMSALFIRDIDETLMRALRVRAATEGITMKQLVVPLLELAVTSKPVAYKRVKP